MTGKRVTIYLPEAEAWALTTAAKANGRNASRIVRDALREHLIEFFPKCAVCGRDLDPEWERCPYHG